MKQLIQNLKTGETLVGEVPSPVRQNGGILIRNVFSVISAGTERSTVTAARSNLLEKAIQRPDLVRKVFDSLKREGLWATYQRVMSKMSEPRALGYSSAGVVTEADDRGEFKIGDRVACGGSSANHAEEIFAPTNLCVKIPDTVEFDEAAFTTLGSIAMQGIRQAEVSVGERVGVIGLGLIGQLTVQILKAAGCKVFGIDLNSHSVDLAKEFGADVAMVGTKEELIQSADQFTDGHGLDKIIITAATPSNEPIELSGALARDRAIIVIVGLVKVEIPRSPFYEKELEVRMSRSYGPGRYDPWYEEKGIDYPIGYVRWTEKRNMQLFLELIASGKIHLKKIITHRFPIERAVEAYDLLLGKKDERYLGILIEYPETDKFQHKDRYTVRVKDRLSKTPLPRISIGFIGAGNFAQVFLLPAIKKIPGTYLKTVSNATGISSKHVAKKFGFELSTTNNQEILGDPEINTVFIATRHHYHGPLVEQLLLAGKNIFVEKPLCIHPEELENIRNAVEKSTPNLPILQVGFNRRFSTGAKTIKEYFANSQEPKLIQYRINAGFLPVNHWTRDPEVGGGRIVGEICHFIDLLQYLTGADPRSVFAQSLHTQKDQMVHPDNVLIMLELNDGSVANISYVCNGDTSIPKERIEISSANRTAVLNNFETIEFYQDRKKKRIKTSGKGHTEEVEEFLQAIVQGKTSPISFESQYRTTMTTFKIIESLQRGEKVKII